MESAEAYFGIPDETGVYLPLEGFASDLGVDATSLGSLEVNLDKTSPHPLDQLLKDAAFFDECARRFTNFSYIYQPAADVVRRFLTEP